MAHRTPECLNASYGARVSVYIHVTNYMTLDYSIIGVVHGSSGQNFVGLAVALHITALFVTRGSGRGLGSMGRSILILTR